LHETLHATVLVKDQTYFNESLATFVADTMTPEYLAERFGAESIQASAYAQLMRWQRERVALVLRAYSDLEALYSSPLDEPTKLAKKRAILDQLQADLQLPRPPNNASLLGAKLYGTGMEEFEQLLLACRGDWPHFMAAVGSLRPKHFGTAQLEAFGPVLENLIAWRCEPLPD
jgi:predicted aminopeptidase